MSYNKLFGEFFKNKRLALKLSLREFCLEKGFDPGNLSKIERGLMTPPNSPELLKKYADALNIKKGTDDWIEFFDRAAACKGKIPNEILEDDEIVNKLPVFFRTLRGEKVPEEKLNEIINLIRKGN